MKFIFVILASVLLVTSSVCGDDLSNTSTKVSIDKLEYTGKIDCKLIGNSISLIGKDYSVKNIPVRMIAEIYKVEGSKETKEKTKQIKIDEIYKYQIESDNNAVFEWTMWSYSPCSSFFISNNGKGENYFAWADTNLNIITINSENDEYESLVNYIKNNRTEGDISLRLRTAIPEVIIWGANALYREVIIHSLEKDIDNNWIIKITPPVNPLDKNINSPHPYIYTLVSELNPVKEPAIIERKPEPWTKYIWHVTNKEKVK